MDEAQQHGCVSTVEVSNNEVLDKREKEFGVMRSVDFWYVWVTCYPAKITVNPLRIMKAAYLRSTMTGRCFDRVGFCDDFHLPVLP